MKLMHGDHPVHQRMETIKGMNTKTLNQERALELVKSNDAVAIRDRLGMVKKALHESRNDMQRMQARDAAAAFEAAAAIIGYRDIQVEASVLVADAERLIAQNNPASGRGRPKNGDRKNTRSDGGFLVSTLPVEEKWVEEKVTRKRRRLVQEARQAHSGIDDEQYETLKQQAIEKCEPLSRRQLTAISRKARRAEEGKVIAGTLGPKKDSERAKADAKADAECLQRRLDTANTTIEALQDERNQLRERVAELERLMDRGPAKIIADRDEEIKTLRVQLAACQHERNQLSCQTGERH